MQTIRLSICLLFFICIANSVFSREVFILNYTDQDSVLIEISHSNNKNFIPPLTDTLSNKSNRDKFISALTAFPFPFGFMGAHRIMLGTKPWIPVVYVVTLGGCFGLLPLIDFCVIVFSKDIKQYENNPNIFMWVK